MNIVERLELTRSECKSEVIDEAIDEIKRLRSELKIQKSVWCDKPEDRLYHHEDKTWWRRNRDGDCVRADEPEYVKILRLTKGENESI